MVFETREEGGAPSWDRLLRLVLRCIRVEEMEAIELQPVHNHRRESRSRSRRQWGMRALRAHIPTLPSPSDKQRFEIGNSTGLVIASNRGS